MFWPLLGLYVLIAASHLYLFDRLDKIERRLDRLEKRPKPRGVPRA